MPKPANQEVLDATVRHQISILRFSDGEAQASAKLLAESDAELVALLQSGLTETSEKRIRSLLAEVRRMRAAVAERIGERLQGSMDELSGSEADWESSMLEGASPVALSLSSVPPSVLKAVSGSPINGIPLQGWLGKMAANDVSRIEQQVRLGALAGETVDQMVARVRGTRANGFKDGVLQTTRREAEMIARTAVNHVSTAARQATWEANADIIRGVRWVSTLDGRTSPVCQSRDGHVYRIDEGPRPPAHPNCRSTVAPVLDGEAIVGERPTVTDTRTRRAREVDFRQEARDKAGPKWKGMSAAERNAAVKARRDAWTAENVGQTPSTTNYQEWLRGQSREFQDEVLGAGKAELFRKGMPLDKFVDETGRPYSLQDLKAKVAGDKLNVVQPGVGLKAKALLQQGLSNQEVLDQIKVEFPDASTSLASVASYKSELKKAGALDLTPAAKVPSGQLKQAQSVQSVVEGLDGSLPAGVKHAIGGQWSTVVGELEGSPGAYGYYQAGKGVLLDGSKLAAVPAAQARQVAAHELGHLLHKQHDLLLPDDTLAALKAAAKQLTPEARKQYAYYLSSLDELTAEVYAQALSPSALTSQGLGASEFNKAFEGAIDAAKKAMAEKFPAPAVGAVKPVPGGPVLPYEVAGKHTSVGSLAKALLQQGMPDGEVLDAVLAEFPTAKTKLASISSYKSELKKAGLLPNKASGPTVVGKALPDVAPAPPPPQVAVAAPDVAAVKPSAAALTEDELKAEAFKLFKSGVLKPVDVGSTLNTAFPNATVDLYPSTVNKWLAQFKGTQPGAYHNAVALAEKAQATAASVGPLKEPKLLGKQLGPTSSSALQKVKSYLAGGGDTPGAYDVMKSVFGSIQEPGAGDLLELAKYELATAKAAGKPYLDAAFKAANGFEADQVQEQFISKLTGSPKMALDAYVTAKKHGLGPIKTNKLVKQLAGYEPSASFKVKLKEAADYQIAKEKAGLAKAQPEAQKPHVLETYQPPAPLDLTPSRPASNPREGIPPPPRFTSAQRAAAIKKYTNGSLNTAVLDKINRLQKQMGLEEVTAEEAASIRAYTGSSYRRLNSQLRDGEYSTRHELQAFVEAAQHGLAKMPKFVGRSSRGMRFSPSELEKVLATYRRGEVVTESAFVSSSSGEQAAFGGNVFLKINGRTGVDVSKYSYYQREREVLFMPGTQFRVDKVEQVNGKYIIEVTEV